MKVGRRGFLKKLGLFAAALPALKLAEPKLEELRTDYTPEEPKVDVTGASCCYYIGSSVSPHQPGEFIMDRGHVVGVVLGKGESPGTVTIQTHGRFDID